MNTPSVMQKSIVTLILSVLFLPLYSQSYFQKFRLLFKEKDSAAITKLLADWEKNKPQDPELYTCAFNFYFSNSKREIVSLQQAAPAGESFQLKDSTGKTVAFLGANKEHNPVLLEKAFRYINKGIEKFPDRLDMRFGKCFVLNLIKDYSNFTSSIIETVERSVFNKNKWLWTENQPKAEAEKTLLSGIQDYLRDLYNTGDDNLLQNMVDIGTLTLKYYPDHVEILSTTSVALLLKKEYAKAIAYLKHAEELNPKDFIVLNNIAHGYKLQGDKANAVRYYELVEKYGDEEAKAEARENIRKLK